MYRIWPRRARPGRATWGVVVLTFATVALVILVLWVLPHVYVVRGLLRPLNLQPKWKRVAWGAAGLAMLSAPAGLILPRLLGESLDPLPAVAFVYMGIFFFLLLLSLVRDLVLVPPQLLLARFQAEPTPRTQARRAFLGNAVNFGILSLTGGLNLWGFVEARRLPRLLPVDVPIRNLPPDLEGFTIVQLSDLHMGATLKRPFLEAVVDVANAQQPDLVAVTGDLADGYVDELRHDVEPLARLRARHGVYYVTGNHEYYWDAPGWEREAERLGAVVLSNRHVVLRHGAGKVVVAGVTDFSAERHDPEAASDPKKALAGAPADAHFRLLLAHQPKSVWAAAETPVDLQLSGHTHGGQVFPYHVMVGLAHPFVAGLHVYRNMQIYVSRGTGYWGPPLRLGAPSEITVLRLRRAEPL
jgi:predicted MPP superfamily phosphohydrolase